MYDTNHITEYTFYTLFENWRFKSLEISTVNQS